LATTRFAEVLKVRLSGEAIETLTFTGPFLAEPAKGWLLTRRGLAGVDAFSAVAIEYLMYTLTSAWMSTIALWLLLSRAALPRPPRAGGRPRSPPAPRGPARSGRSCRPPPQPASG